MLHGGVLTPDGMLRPDANTLVIIHTQDFREGYQRGRRDYFTRYQEIVHTEDDLLELFTAHAQDNRCLGREDTLQWAVCSTVGELCGQLFPLTQSEQPPQHPTQQVKRMTVLQGA
jgi:hypothetical protein